MECMDDDEDLGFSINKDYADKYDRWREKEERQKLIDKYGDVSGSEDSSSSESEDETAEALTAQKEKDWLRTLAALKSKDPRIYDPQYTFYKSEDSEDDVQAAKAKPDKEKTQTMTLKDYERKVILEKGGQLSDESDDEEAMRRQNEPGYFEEQEEIKKSFKTALESDDEEDDLLTERKKSQHEKEKEEEEYLEWLKGQKDQLETDSQTSKDLKPLKQYWGDPELSASEKYLRDYILNKRYCQDDDESMPTYDEILEEDLSEDEKALEKQENFEMKYNFRFEHPDPEFIKSYPRTIEDSVRRTKNKRAEKRKETKAKKQQEKERKREELKRLKNLKKKEITERLEMLKEITGNPDVGFSEKDLEGDFDPSQYDSMMQKVFDQQYYDMDEDNQKPVFDEEEELGLKAENWDNWDGQGQKEGDEEAENGDLEGDWQREDQEGLHCEDPDFCMDADYDPTQDLSHGLDGRKKKKRKKSKFTQVLEAEKPDFDPSEKTYEEYLDEYYSLDFEDIIGDMPCRFKYRKVPANDYGLTTDEVLACPERELNSWVSVKKMSQYRTEEEEKIDMKVYRKKAANMKKKLNVLQSLKQESKEDVEEEETKEAGTEGATAPTKKKQKKKKKKNAATGTGKTEIVQNSPQSTVVSPSTSQQKQTEQIQKQQNSTAAEDKTGDDTTKPAGSQAGRDHYEGNNTTNTGIGKRPREEGGPEPDAKKTKISTDTPLVKKNKKKKKKKKAGGAAGPQGAPQTQTGQNTNPKLKKKLKMSDERLKAYGINPKKFKYVQFAKKQKQKK